MRSKLLGQGTKSGSVDVCQANYPASALQVLDHRPQVVIPLSPTDNQWKTNRHLSHLTCYEAIHSLTSHVLSLRYLGRRNLILGSTSVTRDVLFVVSAAQLS